MGFGSLAAAGAAFAAGFICYALTPVAGPVDPATGEPGSVALPTTVASSTIAKPISGRASFGERFGFDGPDTSVQIAQAPQVSASFGNRFYGEELASAAPVQSSVAPARTTVARASIPIPKPRAPARPAVAEAAPKPAAKAGFQLASAVDTVLALGYAPADTATSSETGVLKELVRTRSPTRIPVTPPSTTSRPTRFICRTDGGWKPIPALAATWTIPAPRPSG